MKKLLLIMLAFSMSYAVNAQIQTPAPSPFSKIEQKVGLTDVTIEYSRPGMRGRTIFGDLVPYGKLWRAGANSRTKITFSDDVTVGESILKAGSYAIFITPEANAWEVVFYTEANGGGAPAELDESKVAARVTAETHAIPFDVQNWSIDINNLTNNGGSVDFIWEKTYVSVPFGVPTDAIVSKSIESALAGPSANDYYAAATYYLSEGKDVNKAKMWIDKAMSMLEKPAFWQLRQQSLIYAAAGDKKGAIAIAKKSLAASKEAKNADYIKMNEDSLKKWMQ